MVRKNTRNAPPDRFYIDESDKRLYKEIEQELFISRYTENGEKRQIKKGNKERFLLAMAIGFNMGKGHRIKLKKKFGFFFDNVLYPADRALISSIAVFEKKGSVDILTDKEDVNTIAEEYARAGIKTLHGKIRGKEFGTFSKRFEKMLFEVNKKI